MDKIKHLRELRAKRIAKPIIVTIMIGSVIASLSSIVLKPMGYINWTEFAILFFAPAWVPVAVTMLILGLMVMAIVLIFTYGVIKGVLGALAMVAINGVKKMLPGINKKAHAPKDFN